MGDHATLLFDGQMKSEFVQVSRSTLLVTGYSQGATLCRCNGRVGDEKDTGKEVIASPDHHGLRNPFVVGTWAKAGDI